LTRTSVFIGREQLEDLRRLSRETGLAVAVMIRHGIQLYLGCVTDHTIPGRSLRVARSELVASEPAANSARTPSTMLG
jgi:hypothetical protein